MDYTFFNEHPTDRTNDFLKAIFKKQVKRVTAKTAKKAGLSDAETKAFQAKLQSTMDSSGVSKKITNANRLGNIGALAAATVLTGGIAAGKIAPGLLTVKAGGGAGLLGGAKKLISKVSPKKALQKIADPTPWLGGNNEKTTAGQALDAIGQMAKDKAPELLQGLKDKGLAELSRILSNSQTSPELLPKNREQKQLEATAINGGATVLGGLDSILKNPLVIAAIVLLGIAVVVSLVKRNG